MVKLTFEFTDQREFLELRSDLCIKTAEGIVSWAKTQCNENILLLFARKKPMAKRICTILLSNSDDADKTERIADFLKKLGLYVPIKEKYADSLGVPFFSTLLPPIMTLKVFSPAAYSLFDEIFTAWEKAKLGKYINLDAKQSPPASVPIFEKEEVKAFLKKPSDCWF